MHWYKALEEDLEYKDHHPPICWKFHIPQCHEQLHPEFVIGSEACEFKNIILPVVTAAFKTKNKELCREFGKKGEWHNVLNANDKKSCPACGFLEMLEKSADNMTEIIDGGLG
jgi:hypothetical protein